MESLRRRPGRSKPFGYTHCARCGYAYMGERCGGCRERRRELIRRLAELLDCRPDEVREMLAMVSQGEAP